MEQDQNSVIANPWQALRAFTDARIALGRSGVSQPSTAQLAFQLAHAQARDAVHRALAVDALAQQLQEGLAPYRLACLTLHSAAASRAEYLQRPDLGRRLDASSRARLEAAAAQAPQGYDLALVIGDGLSALAIETNVLAFLTPLLAQVAPRGWRLAPLTIVSQARVAVGDEIGQVFKARLVVVLIGERPGLSSPDSMGIYMTWQPRVGATDASRNCISNVRPAGLGYEAAAHKLDYLMNQALRRQLSGVALKDDSAAQGADAALAPARGNFLLD